MTKEIYFAEFVQIANGVLANDKIGLDARKQADELLTKALRELNKYASEAVLASNGLQLVK